MRDSVFRHDGLAFEVRDAGPADGEAVVLLHGFPQDSSTWDAVAPRLNDHGLRTLAPDQRGYSPGARPRRRRDYRLPLLVADVVALLDDRGIGRAHLVGHDWDGAVVWAAAAAVPDRVASATVLSTPHPAAMASALVGEQGLASWYMAFFQLPLVPEAVLRRVLPGLLSRSGVPAPAAERYATRMAEPGALSAALGWYRALPFSRAGVGDSVVPTTYVWGAQDPALRRRAAERTGRHVRADYRFVELDGGHWLPETRPDEVVAAVLERVRRP